LGIILMIHEMIYYSQGTISEFLLKNAPPS
jgi:hypothetical protein